MDGGATRPMAEVYSLTQMSDPPEWSWRNESIKANLRQADRTRITAEDRNARTVR